MNKKWKDQNYVVHFLLSVMVLIICGAVSYGIGYCQSENDRYREAGLAQAKIGVDEHYISYMSSGQRIVEVGQLIEKEEGAPVMAADAQPMTGAGSGSWADAQQTDMSPGNARLDMPEGAPRLADGAASAGTPQEGAHQADAPQEGAHQADAPQEGAQQADALQEETQQADAPQEETQQADTPQGGADQAKWPQARIGREDLSESDYEVLLRIVQAEAGNEDTKGKILVANVVLNRVMDARFPGSVTGVVFQNAGGRAQFSPVANGTYYSVVVSEDTKEAVDRALAGEDYSEGALYFAARRYAGSSQMRWFDECLTKLFAYGGHEFFTG